MIYFTATRRFILNVSQVVGNEHVVILPQPAFEQFKGLHGILNKTRTRWHEFALNPQKKPCFPATRKNESKNHKSLKESNLLFYPNRNMPHCKTAIIACRND